MLRNRVIDDSGPLFSPCGTGFVSDSDGKVFYGPTNSSCSFKQFQTSFLGSGKCLVNGFDFAVYEHMEVLYQLQFSPLIYAAHNNKKQWS